MSTGYSIKIDKDSQKFWENQKVAEFNLTDDKEKF